MIDWNRAHDLREEIGADEFTEVVELFLEEVETEIAALRETVPLNTLESRLHFLKGSALNLGFERFSKMCQAGETAASDGAADQVDIASILASYDASKVVFLKGLRDMKAA
jgi:HPt (histidine-containing phosphotransfer) domain-containing protein